MTRGFGTMYSYAARIPARDRWAIAAYIRALQLSQHALAGDLSRGGSEPAPGGRAMSTAEHDGRSASCEPGSTESRPAHWSWAASGWSCAWRPGSSGRSTSLPAYLVGYLFWLGIALGCIGLTMLHHLIGGSWGLVIRRPLEAGALTVMPLALLFVPIAFGVQALYPWAAGRVDRNRDDDREQRRT